MTSKLDHKIIMHRYDYVSIEKFLPFMFLFLLSKKFNDIEERRNKFIAMLGEDQSHSMNLIKLFEKHGLDPQDLYKKKITYQMVEKVVVDVRSQFSKSFKFDQIDLILKKVKDR